MTCINKNSLQEEEYQARKMIALGTMISGIAHELNNPITSISMNIQMLRMCLSQFIACENNNKNIQILSESVEHLNQIDKAVAKSSKVVKELLEYSRKSSLDLENANLASIIFKAFKTVEEFYPDYPVTLSLHGEETSSLNLMCDATKILQLFINLFKNSYDAILKNDRCQHGMIQVHLIKHQKLVTMKITDNGTGIQEEHMPRIFEPFFTTKTAENGTGLGLGICYEIIKQHRGDISVKNSPDTQGAEFEIKLPISL